MRSDVDRAKQRARQYWYDDGLSEIAAGAILLAIGVLSLVEAMVPQGSLVESLSAIGIVVLVAGGIWLANWAVREAKSRITYPRTGFVRYRRRARTPQKRLLVAAIAFALSVLVSFILNFTAPASLAWIPAIQGWLIGAFILYMAYMLALVRFYLLAMLSFVLGPFVALAGLGDTPGNGVYFTGMGFAVLLSGTITLIRYLRSTQLPEGE